MSYKKDKKYKEALKLFYGANRYILNNRMLPGTPTLPSIVECLVTFTNTSYPELPVKLPKYIVNFKWAYITLPTVTGTYEDEYNLYTPVRWSIGDFNTNVLLKNSVKANLEFDVEPKTTTRTLSFTNTTYPQFIVDLPDPITAEIGDSVILPSVSGYFEDEENLYIPSSWDIGSFGDSYTITGNTTSNLEWKVEHIAGFICGSITEDTFNGVSSKPSKPLQLGDVDIISVYLSDETTPISGSVSVGNVSIDNINLLRSIIPPFGDIHEYIPPQGSPICGSMGLDYSESVVDFLPERMDRGGVEFTGELRESIIPESGVVIPYVAKYSYIVLDKDTGKPKLLNTDTGIEYADAEFVSLQDDPLLIIEEEEEI